MNKMKNIYKIILNTVWVSVICLMFFNGKVSAKDISVEVGDGKDYTTIKAAINAAADGDTITITVGDGIYKENIVIEYKSNLTLKSENGYEHTTIAGIKNAPVVDIRKSNNVTVNGFHYICYL